MALVVSGTGAEPVLEWALGSNKRGAMTSPLPSGVAATHLELKLDPETGELQALVGEGRDQRPLGEKLVLGKDWKALFGKPPRAAVGCLEGTCGFRSLRVEGLMLPPPTPQRVDHPSPTDPRQDARKGGGRADREEASAGEDASAPAASDEEAASTRRQEEVEG